MEYEGQIEACPRNVRERAAVRPGSPVGVVKAEVYESPDLVVDMEREAG